MKKQRPRDHSQSEDQNPKPKAGRQPGDSLVNRRKNIDKHDLNRTEIEEEPELKEKEDPGKKNESNPEGEEIVNKTEADENDPKSGTGKGKSKIVNKKS